MNILIDVRVCLTTSVCQGNGDVAFRYARKICLRRTRLRRMVNNDINWVDPYIITCS